MYCTEVRVGGNFDSVARGGASLLGSGLLVLALCADKRGSRRNRIPPCGFRISAALVLWLLGVPGGLNRDRHGIRWRCPLGPAIACSLGFLMSPTRALRVTLWEPYSSFPHSTIHSDNYIIAPYYPLGRSLDGIKSSS